MDAIHTRMIQALRGKNDRTRLVIKATSQTSDPPKAKYVRKIILDIWENRFEAGGAGRWFFVELESRPVGTSAVVALKGLIVTMKIIQQGPPEAMLDVINFIPMVQKIGAIWRDYDDYEARHTQSLASLVSKLSNLLVQKMNFHKVHSQFDVLFEIKNKAIVDDEELVNAVSRMLTMQEVSFTFLFPFLVFLNS